MRIGSGTAGMEPAAAKRNAGERNRRFFDLNAEAESFGNSMWTVNGSRLQEKDKTGGQGNVAEDGNREEAPADRSEAVKIYEAAVSGKPNPIGGLREAPKVPYGYLEKDGVIVYNGVCFVCDEKTNSICLGDMTDEENVLNIPLSGGGHLKVNRDSLGLLSKAAGMFSPEDLNLIMRAISEDTKIQSVQKEIEDEKASLGNRISGENGGDGTEN
mgnify:CR=1 FL=1